VQLHVLLDLCWYDLRDMTDYLSVSISALHNTSRDNGLFNKAMFFNLLSVKIRTMLQLFLAVCSQQTAPVSECATCKSCLPHTWLGLPPAAASCALLHLSGALPPRPWLTQQRTDPLPSLSPVHSHACNASKPSVIHSFVRSFVRSFVCSFVRWLQTHVFP